MAMLSVKDLQVYYGSIHAIKGVSFEVNEGEIVTLIGANGAGKTTTLHAICGLVKAKAGEITFCGQNLRTTDPHKIIRLGLAQVPEGRRIFARMTVQENLEMGAYIRNDKSGIDEDYESVFKRLPRLKERRKQKSNQKRHQRRQDKFADAECRRSNHSIEYDIYNKILLFFHLSSFFIPDCR